MARKQGSHSDITGPRVREAALGLIAQHGFAAVSMRQIAAEVGVQVGTLYNYTSDKQTLLFDLLEGHMKDLLARLGDTPFDGSPLERLEAFTRFHIRYHLPRKDAVFIAYMELRNLTPENFDRIQALRRSYEDRLEEILQAGEADGTFVMQDSRMTTLALIAMLTAIPNWYRAGGRLSQNQIEDSYLSLVRKAVLA